MRIDEEIINYIPWSVVTNVDFLVSVAIVEVIVSTSNQIGICPNHLQVNEKREMTGNTIS